MIEIYRPESQTRDLKARRLGDCSVGPEIIDINPQKIDFVDFREVEINDGRQPFDAKMLLPHDTIQIFFEDGHHYKFEVLPKLSPLTDNKGCLLSIVGLGRLRRREPVVLQYLSSITNHCLDLSRSRTILLFTENLQQGGNFNYRMTAPKTRVQERMDYRGGKIKTFYIGRRFPMPILSEKRKSGYRFSPESTEGRRQRVILQSDLPPDYRFFITQYCNGGVPAAQLYDTGKEWIIINELLGLSQVLYFPAERCFRIGWADKGALLLSEDSGSICFKRKGEPEYLRIASSFSDFVFNLRSPSTSLSMTKSA